MCKTTLDIRNSLSNIGINKYKDFYYISDLRNQNIPTSDKELFDLKKKPIFYAFGSDYMYTFSDDWIYLCKRVNNKFLGVRIENNEVNRVLIIYYQIKFLNSSIRAQEAWQI